MIETLATNIPRPVYIEKVRPFIGTHIIKVLSGQRRCGKSYILLQLIDEVKRIAPDANIIFINTEFAEYKAIKTDADLYDYVASRLSTEHPNHVFIDEIQEIASFESAVKSLFAEEKCELYITGSNAHLLSGELATYLAGRYIQFSIHPLGYAEFLRFHQLENIGAALQKYLRIGGLPYLAALPDDEHLAFEYLKNVYESILLRDVVTRENIRNIHFLENLTGYLADNIGSLFSANNISKYLKNQRVQTSVQTVITYLSALDRAFLIRTVSRAEISGLRIFEIGEKYYFEDLGLRNVLTQKPVPLDIAKVIENAVYLFLIQNNFTVYVGKDGDREVDFIAEKRNQKLYIQVAYRISDEATANREFGNLERIADNFPKYVVTLDDVLPPVNAKGIHAVHLRDFLLMQL